MGKGTLAILLALLVAKVPDSDAQCVKGSFEYSSFVCVCNSTYCNFDGPTTPITTDQVRVVTSSRDEYRNYEQIFDLPTAGTFNSSDVNITIFIDQTIKFQSMIGFGGAFTDAASINMMSLSEDATDNLLRMYFAEEGNRYNLVRVPIAGSDFSVRPYSYDDVEGDVDLEFFDLAPEDYVYKLPTMRRAIELCPDDLYIFGSPWAPPAWMKSNGQVNESGVLLKQYWQPYSNYLVKFIEAYEAELGVELWGLTPQNEPLGGFDPNWAFNTCGFSAADMRDWIGQNLGPTLESAGYGRLNLMVDDFNRSTLPWYIIPMITDSTSSVYVDGVAIHWYDDFLMGPENLDETHDLIPDKFMVMTEACEGAFEVPEVMLGSWERGERYIIDILENINHWVSGWVDWNLVLDMIGGPNWVDNWVDSPIIVDADIDTFYVQPMYYALSLFSRNVQRGSNRIYRTMQNDYTSALRSAAFLNPDGTIVVIIANLSEGDLDVAIIDQNASYRFKTTVGAKTWVSITFQT